MRSPKSGTAGPSPINAISICQGCSERPASDGTITPWRCDCEGRTAGFQTSWLGCRQLPKEACREASTSAFKGVGFEGGALSDESPVTLESASTAKRANGAVSF